MLVKYWTTEMILNNQRLITSFWVTIIDYHLTVNVYVLIMKEGECLRTYNEGR